MAKSYKKLIKQLRQGAVDQLAWLKVQGLNGKPAYIPEGNVKHDYVASLLEQAATGLAAFDRVRAISNSRAVRIRELAAALADAKRVIRNLQREAHGG